MPIQVYTADNPTDAHFIQGLLETQGIAAEIREAGMIGDYPTLWVAPDDVAAAQQIIATLSLPPALACESWICNHCGETIEAQFSGCWRCGSHRPVLSQENR